MAEFNLQTHLIQMEARIREDIKAVGNAASRAQADSDENKVDLTMLATRVEVLDSHLKYLYSAGFAGVMGLIGFVWKILIVKP